MEASVVRIRVNAYFQNNVLYGEAMDEIGLDESLIDGGYIDSTGIIGLVSFIEKEFGIHVRDQEIIPENFDTLNNLYCYIRSKLDSRDGQGDGILQSGMVRP